MDTDTPAWAKADIMGLCGHFIGQEQHGGPQRSGPVSHLLDYRVKEHTAETGSLLMLFNGNSRKRKHLNPACHT